MQEKPLPSLKNHAESSDDHIHIKPKRSILNIVEIKLRLLIKAERIPSKNLSIACDSRFDAEQSLLPSSIILHFVFQMRSWTDQRHRSSKYRKELR